MESLPIYYVNPEDVVALVPDNVDAPTSTPSLQYLDLDPAKANPEPDLNRLRVPPVQAEPSSQQQAIGVATADADPPS